MPTGVIPTGWVIWLQQSNLEAFVGKISLLLGQVDRGVVWRRVPNLMSAYIPQSNKICLLLPVHQEGNLIGRHLERSFATLHEFVTTGEGESMSLCARIV